MNCPKCKCPNPPGAAFCQLCYETFNLSAADNYVRTTRRQRYEEERRQRSDSTSSQTAGLLRAIAEFLNNVDWSGIAGKALEIVGRYKRTIGIALAILGGVLALAILHSPGVRFRALGHPLTYAFRAKKGCRYLVGFQTKFKSWSEWNHELDTPMEEFTHNEMGNVMVENVSTSGSGTTLGVKPTEWIHIRHDSKGNDSRALTLQDPSIIPLSVQLDPHGRLAQRPAAQASRVGRALNLILPHMPDKSLRLGDEWTESVQWVEPLNDWKIYWTGTLKWKMDRPEDCAEGACVRLTCVGDLHPQLWGSPAWTAGALGRPEFHTAPATGSALFDVKRHRLVANDLAFTSSMRVPIRDLGRIPWELRVGRRVHGVPGDLVLQLDERLDVHEN